MSSEQYHIDLRVTEEYLHASVTGENSIANVNRYLNDIRAAVEESKLKRVLIEDHLTGDGLDTFDVFDIIRNYGRYARDHKLRIAYIDRDREHHRTTVSFGENLANILGVTIHVFEEHEDAVRWLLVAD